MKKIKMLIFITLIFVSLSVIIFYFITRIISTFAQNKSSYVAASIDKEYRLSSIKSPRFVFVGGSNFALGLNSHLITQRMNLPVVNMGLHAGLGLDFILNESISGIRSGDIVILSIEHYLGEGNNKLKAQLADINSHSETFMNLSLFNKIRLLVFKLQLPISGAFYKIIKRGNDPIYYREAFNSYGDLQSHFGKSKPSFISENSSFKKSDYSEGISTINSFIDVAKSKGASVYFTFPPFPETTFKKNIIPLKYLSLQYQRNLKCPILGNLESFILKDQYFFDTVYHLDSIGVQKRTLVMLNLLNGLKVESLADNRKSYLKVK